MEEVRYMPIGVIHTKFTVTKKILPFKVFSQKMLLLNIKPFVPLFDSRPNAKSGWLGNLHLDIV